VRNAWKALDQVSWFDRLRGKADAKAQGKAQKAPQVTHRAGPQTIIRKEQITSPPEPHQAAEIEVKEGARLQIEQESGDGHLPEDEPKLREIARIYRIKRRIGAGAMGTVYLAIHNRWNLDVVIKIPNDVVLSDPDNRHRISREAEIWTALGLHPHIAYCYEVHSTNGIPVLVVEFVDGGNLRDWISDGTCADLKIGMDIGIQFCHALEHAHKRGVIHRDIKPENVLLALDGTLKLTDFGIARALGHSPDPSKTLAHDVVEQVGGATVAAIGTYEYMAPEQFLSAHDVDSAADVFSLGVCLYEMFCGRRPYAIAVGSPQSTPDPLSLRNADLPRPLAELMKRCVDWDHNVRPSAQQVRRELCAIYEETFGSASRWAQLPTISLEADRLNNEALPLLEVGNDLAALARLDEALQANPQHPEATYNRYLLRWRRGEIDDRVALQGLGQMIATESTKQTIAEMKAAIHVECGDTASARSVLEPWPGSYDRIYSRDKLPSIALIQTLVSDHLPFISFAISADCRRGFAGSARGVHVWDLERLTSSIHVGWKFQNIYSTSISGDGSLGAAISASHQLSVWDLLTGHLMWEREGDSLKTFNNVLLSLDGSTLVLWGRQGPLEVWDARSGSNRFTLAGYEDELCTVVISDDSTAALSVTHSGEVCFWDLLKGLRSATSKIDCGKIRQLAVTADWRTAIVSGDDSKIHMWDFASRSRGKQLEGHRADCTSVSITRDGCFGFSSARDRTIRVWQIAAGRCLRTLPQNSTVRTMIATKDGKKLITFDESRAVRLFEIDYRQSVPALYRRCDVLASPESGRVQKAVHKEIAEIDSQCSSGKHSQAQMDLLELWRSIGFVFHVELEALYRRIQLRGVPKRPVGILLRSSTQTKSVGSTIAVDRYGSRVLYVESGREIGLWEVPHSRCRAINLGTSYPFTGLAAGADLSRVVTFGAEGHLELWDVDWAAGNGSELVSARAHEGAILCAALSDDTQTILSGGVDRKIGVWRASDPTRLHFVTQHLGAVQSVAIARDYALSGGGDHSVMLWDIRSAKRIAPVGGHRLWINSVAISHDGGWGVSGGEDGVVKVWNLESGICTWDMSGHSGGVKAVAITADGNWAFSASLDQTLKLWDLKTGICLYTLDVPSPIVAAEVSQDWSYLATMQANGVLGCWRVIWESQISD